MAKFLIPDKNHWLNGMCQCLGQLSARVRDHSGHAAVISNTLLLVEGADELGLESRLGSLLTVGR